jgi:hypothetical protein
MRMPHFFSNARHYIVTSVTVEVLYRVGRLCHGEIVSNPGTVVSTVTMRKIHLLLFLTLYIP